MLIHSSSVFLPGIMKGKPNLSHGQRHHSSVNPHLWYPEVAAQGLALSIPLPFISDLFPHPNVCTFYIFTSLLTFIPLGLKIAKQRCTE